MRSIYDLMEEGTVLDEEDNQAYPDIMTLAFDTFEYRTSAEKHYLSDADIKRIDSLMSRKYGVAQYDDLVLLLNGVDYLYEQEPGVEVKLPTLRDIERFYAENR